MQEEMEGQERGAARPPVPPTEPPEETRPPVPPTGFPEETRPPVPPVEPPDERMEKRYRGPRPGCFGSVLILIALLTAGAILGIIVMSRFQRLHRDLQDALRLGMRTEITDEFIEEKLQKISELATSSFEYKNKRKITNTRQLFSVDIPLTTNSVELVYQGVIKVGYDVSEIDYDIDNERRIVLITLPKPRVLDNYIIFDTLQCRDGNNILNPIGTQNVLGSFQQIEADELKKAEDQGIYEMAREQVEFLITNFISAFPDYMVVFR